MPKSTKYINTKDVVRLSGLTTDEEIAEQNGLIDAWEPVNDEYGQVQEDEAENLKSKDQGVKAAAQARVDAAQKKSEDAFAPVGNYIGSMVAKYGEAPTAQEQQPEAEAETPVSEQKEAKSDTFVLTLEALEASNLDDSVKSGARAWLNGDKSPANQLAYLIAEDYVRNSAGNLEQGGSNADTAQLGESGAGAGGVSTGSRSGEGGPVDTQDDAGGVPVGTESGEGGTGSVASGNGEKGDSGVSDGASGNGVDDAGSKPDRSGGNRSNGGNGRRGSRKDSGKVPSGHAGWETRAELEANLDDALAELDEILGRSITDPIKG